MHALSWAWMLEKSGKTALSRSMLRKWFDAFVALDPAGVGVLSLKTNRRPDAEIEACLVGGKIDFSKVPEPRRSEVIAELGDERKSEAFFSQLQIAHSDKGFASLEHEVDARLRLHGTPEGIANLKNVALNWAIRKNFPPPDGWISLEQVRTILRATPPAPLPEDFVVPLGYEVPDETFHREFMRDTVAGAGQAIVLTGPPGRGKSTYLSALCEELADLDIPTVRHHFLSTTERGVTECIATWLVNPSRRRSSGSILTLMRPGVTCEDFSKRVRPTTRRAASRSFWCWTAWTMSGVSMALTSGRWTMCSPRSFRARTTWSCWWGRSRSMTPNCLGTSWR